MRKEEFDLFEDILVDYVFQDCFYVEARSPACSMRLVAPALLGDFGSSVGHSHERSSTAGIISVLVIFLALYQYPDLACLHMAENENNMGIGLRFGHFYLVSSSVPYGSRAIFVCFASSHIDEETHSFLYGIDRDTCQISAYLISSSWNPFRLTVI